jgi:hypothetical protein
MVLSIVHIALSTGTPFQRWQNASQVMIEKGKGRQIDNLSIIQLCEADLNFVLHAIRGHHLIRHATKHKVLNPAQFALPGQTCSNAVLNKTLFLDLAKQTLTPGALTDYNATAVFDRVLAGLSITSCQPWRQKPLGFH